MSGPLDAVRSACARVAELARFVRVDEAALERWIAATALASTPQSQDPARHRLGDAETTLAYVVTLDAINFGSGWFPFLHKRPGLSGYFMLATCLEEHFRREGAWSAAALQRIDTERCAALFEQKGREEVRPLLELFARALRELGAWLEARHGGSFRKAIESAQQSAERLVTMLAEMPLYRDVGRYAGFEVPFYKRAQLTAADLAAAFEGRGPGAFRDLERLTLFADNLVPHVLRREGVLVYDALLAARIEREELIPAGSPEEVEIRAVALTAVERAARALRKRGLDATPHSLDHLLWNRGQFPEMKAHPRHRTRSSYY